MPGLRTEHTTEEPHAPDVFTRNIWTASRSLQRARADCPVLRRPIKILHPRARNGYDVGTHDVCWKACNWMSFNALLIPYYRIVSYCSHSNFVSCFLCGIALSIMYWNNRLLIISLSFSPLLLPLITSISQLRFKWKFDLNVYSFTAWLFSCCLKHLFIYNN